MRLPYPSLSLVGHRLRPRGQDIAYRSSDDLVAVWRHMTKVDEIVFVMIQHAGEIDTDAAPAHLRSYQRINRLELLTQILIKLELSESRFAEIGNRLEECCKSRAVQLCDVFGGQPVLHERLGHQICLFRVRSTVVELHVLGVPLSSAAS